MAHELELTTDEEDVTLTIGQHPDGVLTFEGGTAAVDEASVARAIDDTYPNIEYVGGDDEAGAAFPGDFADAEAFVDRTPMDDVIADLESGEYDAHLDAIDAAADRQGVLDAIDERRE